MSDSEAGVMLILYLFWAIVVILGCLEIHQDHVDLFGFSTLKKRQRRMKYKPRMKYLTNLSCEEVLFCLAQMHAPFDCTFEKENDDPKDQMYVLAVDELPLRYYHSFHASIKYRVMVTPAQEGSAVWLFLFAFDRDFLGKTEYNDEDLRNIFSWEVEKLFEKLLGAVRVE